MNIAGELLDVAVQREVRHNDEKLFLEMCAAPPVLETKAARSRLPREWDQSCTLPAVRRTARLLEDQKKEGFGVSPSG